MEKKIERSYLTHAEAMSWGEFLHSDIRKLMKQREAQQKLDSGMVDFIPWTQAMKTVNKEDMKVWKSLYYEYGVRNFNNVTPILSIWKTIELLKQNPPVIE